MFFVVEISGPFRWRLKIERAGVMTRVIWLYFSFAVVTIKFTELGKWLAAHHQGDAHLSVALASQLERTRAAASHVVLLHDKGLLAGPGDSLAVEGLRALLEGEEE